MGTEVELLEAVTTALADTLVEVYGGLETRTTQAHSAGNAKLAVEGLHRWPDRGRIAVGGLTYHYDTRTSTFLQSLTQEDGSPGLPVDLPDNIPVLLIWGPDNPPTAVGSDDGRRDDTLSTLKDSFLPAYAVGEQLTMLARNYGINRPLGLTDTVFRELVKVLMYLDAQTIYACEKILDVLFGAGNYTIWEDLESDMHRVHVSIAAVPGTQFEGKTYLVGAEAQASASASTVVAAKVPEVTYGIWDSADPLRQGVNYAEQEILTVLAFVPGNEDYVVSAPPTFDLTYIGSTIRGTSSQNEGHYWKILALISPSTVQVGWDFRFDGTLASASPDRIVVDEPMFAPWVVGHLLYVLDSDPANNGGYVVEEWISPYEVKLTGAAFVTDTDVKWRLMANYTTPVAVIFQCPRASNVGKTITAPRTPLPANVLLDYTTVPSAQAMTGTTTDGTDRYPIYIWDETAVALALLDLITASGVQVVLETS